MTTAMHARRASLLGRNGPTRGVVRTALPPGKEACGRVQGFVADSGVGSESDDAVTGSG